MKRSYRCYVFSGLLVLMRCEDARIAELRSDDPV